MKQKMIIPRTNKPRKDLVSKCDNCVWNNRDFDEFPCSHCTNCGALEDQDGVDGCGDYFVAIIKDDLFVKYTQNRMELKRIKHKLHLIFMEVSMLWDRKRELIRNAGKIKRAIYTEGSKRMKENVEVKE